MHTLHFRRLGLRSRREGYIIRKKYQLQRFVRAMLCERRMSPERLAPDIEPETLHGLMCQKNPGMTSDSEGSSINYILPPSKWARHKVPAMGVVWHEELHLLLGQVARRYGDAGRRRLAANLILSVPSRSRPALRQFIKYVNRWYPKVTNPMRDTHEEILTNLFQYLNTHYERVVLRSRLDLTLAAAKELHRELRDLGRYLQAAAEVATPNWCFVYEPWKLRVATRPGYQLSFDDGPGKRIGPWAGENRWRAVRPLMWNTAWDPSFILQRKKPLHEVIQYRQRVTG